MNARDEFLVIGYGNDLRGDDGAGRLVADIVDSWALPGVRVVSSHQLTPEMSEELSRANAVAFADACLLEPGSAPVVSDLHEDRAAQMSPHASNPAGLMHMASALYGRLPRAWMVAVPAVDFSVTTLLSETAVIGAWEAALCIRDLIDKHQDQSHA